MLDVHPQQQSAHSWKDFFIHIATIVVGLLLAVGLEQTVEAVHHHHQRHELEEALQRDNQENSGYIKYDVAIVKSTMAWALQNASAIEQAGPTGQITLHRLPVQDIFQPNAGVWLTAKANGAATLLTAGEQNWLEGLSQLESTTFVSNSSSLNQFRASFASLEQAITGRAVETPSGDLDLSSLTPAQRATVIDDLRLIAGRSRSLLKGLIFYSMDSEYIFTTPPDQLSDANQLKRFFVIYADSRKANPELQYTFAAK
jgi:hypothetical protein